MASPELLSNDYLVNVILVLLVTFYIIYRMDDHDVTNTDLCCSSE